MKKMMTLLAVFGLVLALAPAVQATDITVANHSFEVTALGDGGYTGSVPDWNGSGAGSTFGLQNPQDAQMPGTTGSPGTIPGGLGVQVAYLNWNTSIGGSIWQQPDSHTILANQVYTLTTAVGGRADLGFPAGGVSIELRATSNTDTILASKVVTSAEVAPLGTSLHDFTISFNSADFGGQVGEPLYIVYKNLGSGGSWQATYIDNVRLSYVSGSTDPTITLSSDTVSENQAVGTVVGTLSMVNADDWSASVTYTKNGGTDVDSFTIDGTSLKTAEIFDYETKNSYSIDILATDDADPANSTNTEFTISIVNVSELIAHWDFEETSETTLADSTGNHNGTAMNMTGSENSGQIGNAWYFSGGTEGSTSMDYVSIPNGSLTSLTTYTITAWLKTTDSLGVLFSISDNTTDSEEVLLRTNANKIEYMARPGGTYASSATVNNDAWHHVAVTQDGDGWKLYVDGELDTSGTQTYTPSSIGANTVNMGVNDDDGGGFQWVYVGLMDDIGVWDNVLTAEEIEEIYNNGLAGIDLTGTLPPPQITLSSDTVLENQAVGTVVGTLSMVNADAWTTPVSYTFNGGTDDGRFTIDGTSLKTDAVFDYDTKSSYEIDILATDTSDPANSTNRQFTIYVALEPPELLAEVIADSVADFSSVQGQDNWYYGQYAAPGDPFVQFGDYTDGKWSPTSASYPWITANGAHPSGSWPVRRYVLTEPSILRLSGTLQRNSTLGNGVDGRIYVKGRRVYNQFAGPDTAGTVHTFETPLVFADAGDTVDYVVDGLSNNSDYDSTGQTLQIETVNNRTLVADSAADFAGTQGHDDASGSGTWQYGNYTTINTPATFTTSNWSYNDTDSRWEGPGSYQWVTRSGGHASNSESVRRWTSGITGVVYLDMIVCRTGGTSGDGIIPKLFHNNDPLFTETIPQGDQNTRFFSNQPLSVAIGDTVDLVVNWNANNSYDGFDFGITITKEITPKGTLIIIE